MPDPIRVSLALSWAAVGLGLLLSARGLWCLTHDPRRWTWVGWLGVVTMIVLLLAALLVPAFRGAV